MHKVMIIDDNYLIRQSVRASIDWGSLGCEVVGEAGDGEEGLVLLRELRPHILITDIKMPGIDGLEMVRRIRGLLPNAKVIVITAYEQFDYARQAIKTGVKDFIVKPIDDDQLTDALREAVRELEADRTQISLVQDALPVLRQNLFSQALSGDAKAEEIEKTAADLEMVKECYALLELTLEKRNTRDPDWTEQVRGLAERRLEMTIDLLTGDRYVLLFGMSRTQSLSDFPGIVEKITAFVRIESRKPNGIAISPTFDRISDLHSIYRDLSRKLEEDDPGNESGEAGAGYSLLASRVLSYIADNVSDNLSLSDTAARFEVSPSYLSSLIKKSTGETFTEIVNREKIRVAIKLLMDPKLRVGEIGDRLGFSDYTYFYQVFKKVAGCSPKEYRNKYLLDG